MPHDVGHECTEASSCAQEGENCSRKMIISLWLGCIVEQTWWPPVTRHQPRSSNALGLIIEIWPQGPIAICVGQSLICLALFLRERLATLVPVANILLKILMNSEFGKSTYDLTDKTNKRIGSILNCGHFLPSFRPNPRKF